MTDKENLELEPPRKSDVEKMALLNRRKAVDFTA